MNKVKINEVLSDIIHTSSQAILCEDESVARQALGDIAAAIASIIPVERVAQGADPAEYHTPGAAMDVVIDNLTPDLIARICDRHGLKKRMTYAEYMTVSKGCKLTKFKGTKATRLVAVRKGLEGNADMIFEISVDHDNATAVIERDGEMLYQIKTLGLTYRRCVHAAIQVLRSHLAENDGVHRRHRLSRKRRAGILTPEAELAETVARQKEMDETRTVGCPAFRLMTHLPSGFDGVEPTDEDLENA